MGSFREKLIKTQKFLKEKSNLFLDAPKIQWYLIVSPQRIGYPHILSKKKQKNSWLTSILHLLRSFISLNLKILIFVYYYLVSRHISFNKIKLIEILSSNYKKYYNEVDLKEYNIINNNFEWNGFKRPKDGLIPFDLVPKSKFFMVIKKSIKSLISEIIISNEYIKKNNYISNKYKFQLLIISWHLRHFGDHITASIYSLIYSKISVYIDWYENQYLDILILKNLKNKKIKIFKISDFLIDFKWHLNLDMNNDKNLIDGLPHIMSHTKNKNLKKLLPWWSSRLFKSKIENNDKRVKRLIFIYPYDKNLSLLLYKLEKKIKQKYNNYIVFNRSHPNSKFIHPNPRNFKEFFYDDIIISVQTSLISELYLQGLKNIYILKVNNYAETWIDANNFKIIKDVNDLII